MFQILDFILFLIKMVVLGCCVALLYAAFGDSFHAMFEKPVYVKSKPEADIVVNGIHVETGLVYAEGFEEVRTICTSCHSAKLVTQNRATREGWQQTIRWMQQTQGLWDLGIAEPKVLDYLSKYYAPQESGRRKNLDISNIEWYILELDE